MPKGKKCTFTVDDAKEALYEAGGNVYVAAQKIGCCVRKMYDYVDENDLKDYVEQCREKDEKVIDDIALNAVDRLLKKVDEDPSVALKAALSTLRRKGTTRKSWAVDESEEEKKYTLAEIAEMSKSGAFSQK